MSMRLQIDEDLTLLSRYTDCIRTYSIENGLDQIPAIAQRHGIKVMQGVWLSNKPAKEPSASRNGRRACQELSKHDQRRDRRQ